MRGRLGGMGKKRILSIKTKQKISNTLKAKGIIPPSRQGEKLTELQKRNHSIACKGKTGKYKRTKEMRKNISIGSKGRKHTEKTKRKMSKSRSGNKHWNWKGGRSSFYMRIRNSLKMQEWRQSIFIRDNFTCQKCGDNTGGNLEAHHKKSFNELLEEVKKYLPLLDLYEAAMIYAPMWNISNGKTLCEDCHKKTKNWGGKRKK